jgi:hypothetical protein
VRWLWWVIGLGVVLGALTAWVWHVNRQDWDEAYRTALTTKEDLAIAREEVASQASLLAEYGAYADSLVKETTSCTVTAGVRDSLSWLLDSGSALEGLIAESAAASDSAAFSLLNAAAERISASSLFIAAVFKACPPTGVDSLWSLDLQRTSADSLVNVLTSFHQKLDRYESQRRALTFLSVRNRESYPRYEWIQNAAVFSPPAENAAGTGGQN